MLLWLGSGSLQGTAGGFGLEDQRLGKWMSNRSFPPSNHPSITSTMNPRAAAPQPADCSCSVHTVNAVQQNWTAPKCECEAGQWITAGMLTHSTFPGKIKVRKRPCTVWASHLQGGWLHEGERILMRAWKLRTDELWVRKTEKNVLLCCPTKCLLVAVDFS